MQNLPLEELIERSADLLNEPLLSDGDKVLVVSHDLTIAADIERYELFINLSGYSYDMRLECMSPSHSNSEWKVTSLTPPSASLTLRLTEYLWEDTDWWNSHNEEILRAITFPITSFRLLWRWDVELGGRTIISHLDRYEDSGTRGDFVRLVRFLYFTFDQEGSNS
jgi:hypothetical protein